MSKMLRGGEMKNRRGNVSDMFYAFNGEEGPEKQRLYRLILATGSLLFGFKSRMISTKKKNIYIYI